MTYWQTYRPWLIRLINQRIYLSGAGYCPDLLQTAVKLKLLIDYNGYRSDRTLASLIVRKQREIKIIIPTNHAHQKQLLFFNLALEQAQSFQLQNT